MSINVEKVIGSVRDMIKEVRLEIVAPGDCITDGNGVKYIKMEGQSTVLRVRDGKVILLSCVPYPVTVTKPED